MAKWTSPPRELVAAFDDLIAHLSGAERRQMFGCPCAFTRLTNQLFTGLHQSDWLVRLPANARDELAALGAVAFAPMDRPMTEYLLLPAEIRDSPDQRLHWVRRALSYANSLPVKQQKPRKTKKK